MSEHIIIRLAEPVEREMLEALQRRASLANEGDREALLANPEAIHLPQEQIEDGLVFVAEHDARVVGFAAMLARDDVDFDLDGLFVEPRAWRTGIGRALVDRCVRHAHDHGAGVLHVIGNPHAARFYVACGFVIVGDATTLFGPALAMKRPI